MAPKISIVFTSYNHKEFLEEALNSLINQTFKDFELIIIDDCSTDGSQEVLKRYDVDLRVKLHLLEKNSGSYVHSSNLGAIKATADYIIFAQCDDYAEKTQLEKLYKVMQQNPITGVAFSSSRMVDKDDKNLGCDFEIRENRFKRQCENDAYITGLQMRDYFLYSCVIPNLSAALIKRSLFEKLNGLSSNYLVLADWDFWLKMSLECDFYYIRESLNNFRQHKSTIRETIKLKRQINEVFEMFFNFFRYSKIGYSKQLYCEYTIANIWLSYFRSDKVAWFKSLIPLQIAAFKRRFYFPVIFLVASFIYPFALIRRSIIKIKKHFENVYKN
jgi:glycosyltransferase involved in cell wall biosynthesis